MAREFESQLDEDPIPVYISLKVRFDYLRILYFLIFQEVRKESVVFIIIRKYWRQ